VELSGRAVPREIPLRDPRLVVAVGKNKEREQRGYSGTPGEAPPVVAAPERVAREEHEEGGEGDHVRLRVQARGREAVRRLVQPHPAEGRHEEQLELEDEGQLEQAHPPIEGATERMPVEGEDEQGGEGDHHRQLAESPPGVLRERDAAARERGRVAEE